MIRCLNPECFHGDPGNPPEYASDNAVDCARCGNEIDLDSEPNFEADEGGTICAECRHHCYSCDDAIGDNESEYEYMALGDLYCGFCFALELTAGLDAA